MCLQCHLGLSDETILKQLNKGIEKGPTDFPIFNSTSISHIIISTSGYNGLKVRNVAIKFLIMYTNWLKNNTKYILDKSLSQEILIPMIEKIKINQVNNKTIEDLDKYFKTINK